MFFFRYNTSLLCDCTRNCMANQMPSIEHAPYLEAVQFSLLIKYFLLYQNMWLSLRDLQGICIAIHGWYALPGIANFPKLTQITHHNMHASRVALLLHGYVVTGEVVCSMQRAQACQANRGLNMGATGCSIYTHNRK